DSAASLRCRSPGHPSAPPGIEPTRPLPSAPARAASSPASPGKVDGAAAVAPRRFALFHHVLQHLSIAKGIHRAPEAFILVGHQLSVRDQSVERLVNQLFPISDEVEYLRTKNKISAVDPDFRLLARPDPFHRGGG